MKNVVRSLFGQRVLVQELSDPLGLILREIVRIVMENLQFSILKIVFQDQQRRKLSQLKLVYDTLSQVFHKRHLI